MIRPQFQEYRVIKVSCMNACRVGHWTVGPSTMALQSGLQTSH